jgi:sn-glycerol 3-phosphate transport system substrate-binding protein
MKKLISIFVLLVSFAFTSNSYSKNEIHWWYGNSVFLGDVII